MTLDPLPDERLRDDIATVVFTQALKTAIGQPGEALDRLASHELKVELESTALLAFEAAEAFIRTRRMFSGGRR